MSALRVRGESPADVAAARALLAAAFGQEAEALLVDRLRAAGALSVALVALAGEEVVGHVAFSPLEIGGADGAGRWVGLAPLAVAPPHQGRGIGSRLVEEGLAACRLAGARLVCVLGDPHYYRRFGFATARDRGLLCEYEVPPEHFMALPLAREPDAGPAGLVRYRPEFAGL